MMSMNLKIGEWQEDLHGQDGEQSDINMEDLKVDIEQVVLHINPNDKKYMLEISPLNNLKKKKDLY